MVNGALVHGLVHPEFGHMRIPHDRALDPFDGVCPYHGDCWEGLASGRALEARWGRPADELGDAAAWDLEASYLALGLVSVVSVLSPERIVLGGGVMKQPGLLALVRQQVRALLNGYVPRVDEREDYIVSPELGTHAGVLGAIALARTHDHESTRRG
jgi:fructokinase